MHIHGPIWKTTSRMEKQIANIHQQIFKLADIYEARERHKKEKELPKCVEDTLNELRKPLPGAPEENVAALEAKLSELTRLYEAWARFNTDRASINSIAAEVRRLTPDPDEGEKQRNARNLAIFMTLVLFVGSVVTVIVHALGLTENKSTENKPSEIWDLMSYLSPALAALFAGMTAYVKKFEKLFFWTSSAFVLFGVLTYSASKSITTVLIWNWAIGYGLAASLFLGPYVWWLRHPEHASRSTRIAAVIFVVLLLLGVGFDVYESHGQPTQGFNRFVDWAAGWVHLHL